MPDDHHQRELHVTKAGKQAKHYCCVAEQEKASRNGSNNKTCKQLERPATYN
jgi:hypothetical protein